MTWVHSETWHFGPTRHTATITAVGPHYSASVVFYGPEVENKRCHSSFDSLEEAQDWCERHLASPPLPTTRRAA